MKTWTKGAVAGASALVLLGGAASLAYWNGSGSVAGGTISAGRLTLTESTPGAWTLNGSPLADVSAVRAVPGDTLLFTGSWTISATGDDLEATVDVTGLEGQGGLADDVSITETYTVDGTPLAGQITDDHDGDVLAAEVVVDFPFGTGFGNTSQGHVLDLTDVRVAVAQGD
ncbi:alternate-type signal peptide domain-containing protein [Aeromicrobium sp. JJY06]|uniref:alternate-type signal peptide domain-containing protein n=1 Tax=Aeromicrobium sp. JJY06 TaxID=3373478 RepID=UPI00376F2AA4